MAGIEWLSGYLKRHPSLSPMKSHPMKTVSLDQATSCNIRNVDMSFDNPSNELSKTKNIGSGSIYNMDETKGWVKCKKENLVVWIPKIASTTQELDLPQL